LSQRRSRNGRNLGPNDAKIVNIAGGFFGALIAGVIGPIWAGVQVQKEPEMAATLSTAGLSRPLVLLALLVGSLLAATLGLWGYYGTAVFFEMLRTGWLACF
jgi:hypothetical protein